MAGIFRTCSREILANMLMGIPPIARRRIAAGRTSQPPAPEQIRRYAFGLILDNPAIQPLIVGAEVLEIGPGDHLATGLALLANGATSYTAMDRFPGDYAGRIAHAWYELVRSEWRRFFPTEMPAELRDFPTLPIVHVLPVAIEDADALPRNRYDLVVSQAVGEHVQDIDAFAAATHRMLRPGGSALHNIDFSSHGLFDDPGTFLRIPDWIWNLMASNRGLPNRKRVGDFVRAFSACEFSRVEIVGQTPTWASFLLQK